MAASDASSPVAVAGAGREVDLDPSIANDDGLVRRIDFVGALLGHDLDRDLVRQSPARRDYVGDAVGVGLVPAVGDSPGEDRGGVDAGGEVLAAFGVDALFAADLR